MTIARTAVLAAARNPEGLTYLRNLTGLTDEREFLYFLAEVKAAPQEDLVILRGSLAELACINAYRHDEVPGISKERREEEKAAYYMRSAFVGALNRLVQAPEEAKLKFGFWQMCAMTQYGTKNNILRDEIFSKDFKELSKNDKFVKTNFLKIPSVKLSQNFNIKPKH